MTIASVVRRHSKKVKTFRLSDRKRISTTTENENKLLTIKKNEKENEKSQEYFSKCILSRTFD